MTTRPPIIVSSLDLERLERLLDGLKGPAAEQAKSLELELERADVVEPKDMPPTVVSMNSRVRFSINGSSETFNQTLVYPKDADGAADKISVLAPIGSALLGLSVGATIDWPRPKGGITKVTIEEIIYQPESEGELHR